MSERRAEEKSAVGHYTFHFLTPSQTFIYGQVTGLRRYRPVVFANNRLNADTFPWPRVHTFPENPPAWLLALGRLAGLGAARLQALWFYLPMRRERVRLLHAHFAESAVRLLPAQRMLGLPMVVSFYGYDATTYPLRPGVSEALAQLFARAQAFTVLSEDMRAKVIALGCPPERAHVIPQGVDLTRFSVLPRTPHDGPLRLLTVANFVEKKGLPYLIEAMASARSAGTETHLRLVGDGPLREALVAAIEQHGLGDAVELLGFLPHAALPEHMAWADVYVQPSVTAADGDQEGLPTAIMEAMATGLPAIATRHAGIPDLVLPGETGWLAPERDSEALAETFAQAARDPQARARMGAEARAHVERAYDQVRQVARLEDLYDVVLGHATSATEDVKSAASGGDTRAAR